MFIAGYGVDRDHGLIARVFTTTWWKSVESSGPGAHGGGKPGAWIERPVRGRHVVGDRRLENCDATSRLS